MNENRNAWGRLPAAVLTAAIMSLACSLPWSVSRAGGAVTAKSTAAPASAAAERSTAARAVAEAEIARIARTCAAGTEVLLGSMERCVTGLKRLRGMLPPGTQVEDKTGTIGGTVNDVGIIALPDGRGRIAIAVFIKKSAKPFEEREHVIAQIARSVYDYMLIENVGR
jgi:hypothetical protein